MIYTPPSFNPTLADAIKKRATDIAPPAPTGQKVDWLSSGAPTAFNMNGNSNINPTNQSTSMSVQRDPVSGGSYSVPPEKTNLSVTRDPITGGTNQAAPAAPMTINRDAPIAPTAPPPAGTSATEYINRKTADLNNGQDPGYSSDAGRLYSDAVTKGLTTPDASSVNAQNTEDTAAARRQYLARVQAGETLGQTSFAPGSAQATRIQDQSQAGVNAANQAGQAGVNAYVRQRTEDNLTRANALDTKQYGANRDILGDAKAQDQTTYNRGQDAITNQHWDTTNSQSQAQLAIENKVVANGADETKKRNLIASLPEGPAKNKVTAGLADGSLSITDALGSVMNPDGSIKPEFQGTDPATAEVQGNEKSAEAWVSATTDLQKGSQTYLDAVKQRLINTDKTTQGPVVEAQKTADAKDAATRLSNLKAGEKPAQADIDTLPSVTPGAIVSQGQGAIDNSTTGGWTKINGVPYKVISVDQYRTGHNDSGGYTHTNYPVLQGVDGSPAYIDPVSGTVIQKKIGT